MPNLPQATDRKSLIQNVNKDVILIGKLTDFSLQHPMGHYMNYPYTADIDLSDGTQVPVYLKTRIDKKILVEITGRVVIVNALGPKGTKSIDIEYQLVAQSWKYCP